MKIALESMSTRGEVQYILFRNEKDFLDWFDWDDTTWSGYNVNWVEDITNILPDEYTLLGRWDDIDSNIINMMRI